MQSAAEAAADPAADFSQVQFNDVLRSYPTSSSITCSYTPSPSFQLSPRDWVGLFKVGWNSTKDYYTFVWAEPSQAATAQSKSRQAVFKEYYLPKDDGEFYQFCFVDSSGKVRGLSSPFCFTNTEDQSFDFIPEDDMMVVTSTDELDRFREENHVLEATQQKLLEELTNMKEEREEREKRASDALKQVDALKEENDTLHTTLKDQLQENQRLKEEREEGEERASDALKQVDALKKENDTLHTTLKDQLQENQRLKEEMKEAEKKHHQQEQTEKVSSQSLNVDMIEDKYSRSVIKINQLKEERSKLKQALDTKNEEISRLRVQNRDGERELSRARDNVLLLEVELQSCEKERQRQAAELRRLHDSCQSVQQLQQENQELSRRLSLMEHRPSTPPDPRMKDQCDTLNHKLSEAEHKLTCKNEETVNLRRRLELQDRHIQDGLERLERTMEERNQEHAKRSKMEMQLQELSVINAEQGIVIGEKEKQILLEQQEKEELHRENQALRDDLEGLRRIYSDFQAQSSYVQPDVSTLSREPKPLSSSDGPEHLYESIETNMDTPEDECRVCHHCHESFPGITEDELELHEQTHRVCPFCNLLCDTMDQGEFEDHVYGH